MLSFIPSFLLNHVDVLLGYAICVLFPLPWLNAAIIDLWAKIGGSVLGAVGSTLGVRLAVPTPAPAPAAPPNA